MSLLPIFRKDITAKCIAASINDDDQTIYTLQLRYPRIIHADFMTHRVFSRNASSSRAIPVQSILVRDADMFVPNFRNNQPGMSAGGALSPENQARAAAIWQDAANYCIEAAKKLSNKDDLNVHKQWANRMLEWFGYIDVLVSATAWTNFDVLRDHGMAQDEIQLLSRVMKAARRIAPERLREDQWHLPYITAWDRIETKTAWKDLRADIDACVPDTDAFGAELSWPDFLLLIASAARCCRLSYSKLDGTPTTFKDDIGRFKKLVPSNDPVHASPLEHQAMPLAGYDPKFQGNFRGFAQFRQFVSGQAVAG